MVGLGVRTRKKVGNFPDLFLRIEQGVTTLQKDTLRQSQTMCQTHMMKDMERFRHRTEFIDAAYDRGLRITVKVPKCHGPHM